MKIFFILENYFPHIGGAEIFFQNLAEGLVLRGHSVLVLTQKFKGTKAFEITNGVKIYRKKCWNRYFFTFLSIPKAIKLARDVDLIQTTTYNGAFPAWVASKLTRKKAVLTVLEVWIGKWRKLTEMSWFKSCIHNFLERMIYLLNFDYYTCISKSTKRNLLKFLRKNKGVEVIYPGVDYQHWDPKKYSGKKIRGQLGLDKCFVYLFYGRPGISKGFEYLIKAVPSISKKIPNSKLLAIVSRDKAYEKRYVFIKNLIKKLKINDKVILHNPVSYKNLPNYIQAADCIVVPSLAEGFGLTTVESCALGKPVVLSNTTSLPEVVSGQYILVTPKNIDSIAGGVERVYQGITSQSPKKLFSIQENIKKYLNLYLKLVDKGI